MRILKVTKQFIAVTLLSSLVFSCGSDENQTAPEVETAAVEINLENLTTVEYAVEGMVCAMGCAATIQEEVASLPGVAEAEVDYDAEKATFKFDASIVSEEEIIAKIGTIADGQYTTTAWVESDEETIEEETEDEAGNSADESTEIEVSLPSFEIPNLFTFILDQI